MIYFALVTVGGRGSASSRRYDAAKRLSSETSFGRVVAFGHDIASNRTKVIWPDSNFVYYNFDALNRVDKICENGAIGCPSGLVASFSLNSLSLRTGITRGNGTSSNIGYDLASRLTSFSQDVASTAQDLTRGFTYNLASQIKTRDTSNNAYQWTAPIVNRAYVANKLNQYASVAGVTFSHDLNGNLTSDGSRIFGYDVENRLLSVSGSANLTLAYDPLGRLRQTTAGAATEYLYEGDRLVAEYEGSALLRRYAHGPGVDEPIVWYQGAVLTDKHWLHSDERGSIVATSDGITGAGTIYKYGPYGEPVGWRFHPCSRAAHRSAQKISALASGASARLRPAAQSG